MSTNLEGSHERNCRSQEYTAKSIWDHYEGEEAGAIEMREKEFREKSPALPKVLCTDKVDETKEGPVRRKSCSSYNWSGGISKFELKTMHIPFVVVRPPRISLDTKTNSPGAGNNTLHVPVAKKGEYRGSLLRKVGSFQINTRFRAGSLDKERDLTPGVKKALFHVMNKDSNRVDSLKLTESPLTRTDVLRKYSEKSNISPNPWSEMQDQSFRTNEISDITGRSRLERDRSAKNSIVEEERVDQNRTPAQSRKPSSRQSLNSSISEFKFLAAHALVSTISSPKTKNMSPKTPKKPIKLRVKSLKKENIYHLLDQYDGSNRNGVGRSIAALVSAKKARTPSSDALLRGKIMPRTAYGSPTSASQKKEGFLNHSTREEDIKRLYLNHRSQSTSIDVPSLYPTTHASTPLRGKVSSEISSPARSVRPKTQSSHIKPQASKIISMRTNQGFFSRKSSLPELMRADDSSNSHSIELTKTAHKKANKALQVQTEKLLSTINHTNMKLLLQESNRNLLRSARTPMVKNLNELIGAFESSIAGYEKRKEEFELRRINAVRPKKQASKQ